jgi:hypothetical protein
MLRYRRLERAVWAVFVAYVLAGLYCQLAMGGGDRKQVFPAASWALFARVPQEITDYEVRMLELNGERLASGHYAEHTGDRLPALATIDAYRLIQQLGRALQKDDRDAIARARRALEGIYLRGAAPFRYEVVRRTYDPLERSHGGDFRAARTLQAFDSRAEP